MDNLLVMQKALVEKLGVQMPQEGNPHAIVSMHMIEEQHHKKHVIVNTIERFEHVLNGVENGHVIFVPIIGHEGDIGVQGNSNTICKNACQQVKINAFQCLFWDLIVSQFEILATWCMIP